MTEVVSLNMPPDHRIATVRHFEAGPPAGLELVEPGETYATTKEEEWVSKKKTEVTNTKQIETRVKRQVVLEDGKVVEDTGPQVTTNTTEDSETQEHHQTELRKLGDDETDGPRAIEEGNTSNVLAKANWVSVPNPDGVVREVKQRKVISREETEEVKETEDVQHLGDITDEEFLAAVHSGQSDLRKVLKTTEAGRTIVSTGPRLVHESTKNKKVTDTEDTKELSSVQPDGKIITETQRTTEHEETTNDELPEGAPDQNFQKESFERYAKTREQEDIDYLADGVKVGHEMKFKTETMDVERRGDGVDDPDLFDSLSARARRRANNRQPPRYRGVENGITPLDRKDALTRKPLDFDQEEETRKVETSKWLEHHFGSDSRSSNNSLIDEEEQPPKTNFFKVTIKSQPSRTEHVQNTYVSTTENSSNRAYNSTEPERDRNRAGSYYKGISDWSERKQERRFSSDRLSPSPPPHRVPYYNGHPRRQSPVPDYRSSSPLPDYRTSHSPIPDYRRYSPSPDYGRSRASPQREIINITPTPPQRKKDKVQRIVTERIRHENGYRTAKMNTDVIDKMEKVEEPPPDYSPPSPTPGYNDRKLIQKTRFADTPTKAPKSGNIIGQSIRKLVGKIRSASAERKAAKQRAKRSPSPTYQQGHVIDSNICVPTMDRPVQKYYLGEDPFAGSIYGRENKYDGVKPARISRKPKEFHEERRSQSTLGRFSKSANRLVNASTEDERKSSQTLPRHLSRQEPPTKLENRSNSTINVSIINTVSSPRQFEGPAKPARTYKSNLSRSKSLNVHGGLDPNKTNMYTSNPQLNKLVQKPIGLKSPGLISSINRSNKDVSEEVYNSRFTRNGVSDNVDNKRVFLSSLKDRAPELFKTLEENDRDWRPNNYSTPIKNGRSYNGDIYEPPTRESKRLVSAPSNSMLRRGSSSSTDFSETYHTTKRNDDPHRPSVTNTTKSFSRKTVPLKDGKGVETIESSETTSITKSSYRGAEPSKTYYEERRYNSPGTNPVVIEVRNYRK